MQINIRRTAIKDLKKIDKKNKQRIHAKILELQQFPNVSNVKKLTNFEPAYRLRVGDYRILFDAFENNVAGRTRRDMAVVIDVARPAAGNVAQYLDTRGQLVPAHR